MSLSQFSIPDGMTVETFDEYAKQYRNAQRRAYYAKHPETIMRQRLVSAANLLTRYGMIDALTRAAILERVEGGNA